MTSARDGLELELETMQERMARLQTHKVEQLRKAKADNVPFRAISGDTGRGRTLPAVRPSPMLPDLTARAAFGLAGYSPCCVRSCFLVILTITASFSPHTDLNLA